MNIGNSFQNATDGVFAFLPRLLGFLLILVIGYVIARVVATIITKVLQKAGLDRRLQESEGHQYVERVMPGASPSRAIAKVVFWLIFIFFVFTAIGALRIPAVTSFMNSVLAYLPNVIAAILIFVVASLIAGAVAGAVVKVMGDTPTGKIAATVIPAVVMVIALFMVLEQLQIAPEIVRIAFAATMGALALGLALAFGLGGRSVAERMLEDAYRKGQEQKEQVRQDMQAGRDRAQSQVDSATGSDTGQGTEAGPRVGSTSYRPETGYAGGATGTSLPTDDSTTRAFDPDSRRY